jgi:hypothetical protein
MIFAFCRYWADITRYQTLCRAISVCAFPFGLEAIANLQPDLLAVADRDINSAVTVLNTGLGISHERRLSNAA